MPGTLNLPMSAHLPVTIARPGSVVHHLSAVVALERVRGKPACGAPVPMFIISGTESPPTLGVLWQVVQVPKIALALDVVKSGDAGDSDRESS